MASENESPQNRTGETQTTNNAPRKRRKWPWIVGGLAGLVFLGFLIAGAVAVALLFSGGGGGGSPVANYNEEYVSGEGSERVAVIPVIGTIAADTGDVGGVAPTTTPQGLTDALAQAAEDDGVEAVILEVNSPGGGVTASAEMHDAIVDFKDEADKPVVVSMADTAASGGYYISTPADRIVAYETTLTGSLGVFLQLLDLTGIEEEYGISQRYIKSGEFKTMGNPWEDLTEEERDIFQSIVEENYDEFVEVIVEGRDLPESEVREIADGRVYSGSRAEELGLIDELGGFDRAVEIASDLAEVEDPTVIRYVQEPGLGSLLLSRLQPQPPEAVQVLEAAGVEFSGEPQYLYVPGAGSAATVR
ncbi:MAG: signal peptide peptidase SppA [Rubrobacteraceae bacterium]